MNIDDLPQNTREFQIYAKLSKLSALQLQQELTNRGLLEFRFRTQHEEKMAILGSMDTLVRSKTPLAVGLGELGKRSLGSPYASPSTTIAGSGGHRGYQGYQEGPGNELQRLCEKSNINDAPSAGPHGLIPISSVIFAVYSLGKISQNIHNCNRESERTGPYIIY